MKKGLTAWAPLAAVNTKPAPAPLGESKKFSIFQDVELPKHRRQALAPITHNLEDSTCSFTSVNTSLHQSDFVLNPRDNHVKAFHVKVSFWYF